MPNSLAQIVENPAKYNVSAGFQALSDPLRLQVLDLLRQQEHCVCDLCDALQVSHSKLSFHLKALRESGLVRARQDGRWIYYSLNLAQFLVLEQYLADYCQLSHIPPAPTCSEQV